MNKLLALIMNTLNSFDFQIILITTMINNFIDMTTVNSIIINDITTPSYTARLMYQDKIILQIPIYKRMQYQEINYPSKCRILIDRALILR